CGERSLAPSAGVAVVDEARLEDRLEDVDERVMDDAVAKIALADHPRLGIAQDELLQRPGTIRLRAQLLTEKCKLIRSVLSEAQYYGIICLVSARLLIRELEILERAQALPQVTVRFHREEKVPASADGGSFRSPASVVALVVGVQVVDVV